MKNKKKAQAAYASSRLRLLIILIAAFAYLIAYLMIAPVLFASALEKPIEGYVYNGSRPLKDATIKILMKFKDDNQEVACLTYPTIYTDERGYFITNLGNLRVLGNNNPCEDKWKKGDVIYVIAQGFYTIYPSGEEIIIDSDSGSVLTIRKLLLTSNKFEPLYNELNLARMKITSLKHLVSWDSRKVVFNAEIYNPNNIPIDDAALKIVVTKYNNRNDIVGNIEQSFKIGAFEKKNVQLSWDIKDMKYGRYLYNAVLYTTASTHDRILDRELELRPWLAYATAQNIIIFIMAIAIAVLLLLLLKSKRERRKEKRKGR
ncbi:MAG: hypothetical protein N3D84_03105 [Candidatus Woesearchaeota archaeon]|nr:hypothetical protein [Candidatus Woesearchaeota archaeon]